jgi:hypothetical protein
MGCINLDGDICTKIGVLAMCRCFSFEDDLDNLGEKITPNFHKETPKCIGKREEKRKNYYLKKQRR